MKTKVEEVLEQGADFVEDAVEVVAKNRLFTPKRIAIAAGVVVAAAATVFIVKKVRAAKDESEQE